MLRVKPLLADCFGGRIAASVRACVLALCSLAPAWAQADAAPEVTASSPTSAADTHPVSAPPLTPLASGPRWSELSLTQQDALMPLYGTWGTLDAARKRKWIAIAQNFLALSRVDQSKLHSRMSEWAALSPSDRDVARFNFVATKKIAPADQASTWEAYKALSPEERQRLVAAASTKPPGSATSIKPTPPGKLTPVPVTRHTPASVRELVFSKQALDPNTLLPLPIRAVADQPVR